MNIRIHLLLADLLRRNKFVFGKELADFERNLAHYLVIKYAIGVGTGTDALVYGLRALDIGPGDEVILPAMSFAASAFVVVWVGAKPVFVDIKPEDFQINPQEIERVITRRTKAIMPVHLHGSMADMDAIVSIAKKHNLFIIEDAAQAIGAKFKNKHLGSFGDVVCLSFSPLKILNALGDGGAVITNNPDLANKIFLMRNYGSKDRETFFDHQIIGTSSRLNNFQAGVLNLKLSFLNELISKQRENYALYGELLKGVGDLILPTSNPDVFHNGYRYTVRSQRRGDLYEFLRQNRVRVVINYPTPLPYLKALNYLGYKQGSFPVTEKVAKEVLTLPTNYELSGRDIESIVKLVKKFFVDD